MASELDALRQVLKELKEPTVAESPLERAIRDWMAFVATIEVHYEDEWEEYVHELTTREYLEEICRRLPGYWADYISARIAPWDERFRAVTKPEKEAHLPPLEGEPGWWQLRTPIRWSQSPDPCGE